VRPRLCLNFGDKHENGYNPDLLAIHDSTLDSTEVYPQRPHGVVGTLVPRTGNDSRRNEARGSAQNSETRGGIFFFNEIERYLRIPRFSLYQVGCRVCIRKWRSARSRECERRGNVSFTTVSSSARLRLTYLASSRRPGNATIHVRDLQGRRRVPQRANLITSNWRGLNCSRLDFAQNRP